jgi:uncharacterized protein (DUF1778 family)
MAIGTSGRIVIDLTPEQKKAIHMAIQAQEKNLKQWFLEHAGNDFPHLRELIFQKNEKG